jgi:hypothetical protein
MYQAHFFRDDLIELLHLELRSSYDPNKLAQLNRLAENIRRQLIGSSFESSLSMEIWESLSGFELGVKDLEYRKKVAQSALNTLQNWAPPLTA